MTSFHQLDPKSQTLTPICECFCRLQYELEVNLLKQQLQEAQARLRLAEERLADNPFSTDALGSQEVGRRDSTGGGAGGAGDAAWQSRLEESEERMRRQQAEKDDQMKNIIQR